MLLDVINDYHILSTPTIPEECVASLLRKRTLFSTRFEGLIDLAIPQFTVISSVFTMHGRKFLEKRTVVDCQNLNNRGGTAVA